MIKVTTRSGQGVTTPHGSLTASYGSFETPEGGFDLAYGTKKWGNFIALSGLDSGRFLDPPEFKVMHDNGNEENLFDRVDYQLSTNNSFHLNLGYTRSWFQTPIPTTPKTPPVVRHGGRITPGSTPTASGRLPPINARKSAPTTSRRPSPG